MKYTLNLLIVIILLLPTIIYSQKDDFNSLMDQLAKEIQQVESKKYTYEQTLTFDKDFPYRVSFEASRIDSKGKTKNQTLTFNLKDFDVNSVRRDNVKDVLVVQLNVDKKQKFIGLLEDDKRGKYLNEVEIITTDINNAKEIQKLLKKIIPMAKDIPPPAPLPATFESRIAWLEKNIIDAERNGAMIQQKISKDGKSSNRLVFEAEKEMKKGSEKNTYHFNLSDLKGKKMRLEVKGKNIFLEIDASKKFIRHEKNGELENFKDDFKIYVKEDIALGKDIVEVFQKLIEEASKKADDNLLATKGGIAVGSADDGKTIHLQKMTGACLMTFESTYEDKKGKTKTSKSIFNLDDLKDKSVDIKVSKKTIWINAKTENSKRLVHNFENETFKSFTNEIKLRGSNVENAKLLKQQLIKKIKDCEGKAECTTPNAESDSAMNFVKENIKDIEIGSKSFQQSLTPTEEDGQWRFSQTEIKKKGGKEKAYIFNLSDIDPKKLDFDVSKKSIVVILQTQKNEEIIKTYVDGDPDDYEKKIKIYLPNISSARNFICALKKVLEN